VKKILFGALTAWLAFVMVSCGGGGGDSADARPFSPPFGPGRVSSIVGLIGIVVDSTNGNPIPGVTIAAGTLSTTTDATGNFALPTIPNGSNVVSFTLTAYAPQSRTVMISSNVETSLIVQMVPNAASDPFDPAVGGTLTVSGSPAQLALGGGVLRKTDGTAPSAGTATALLTPIRPSLDPYLLPGEYVVTQLAGTGAPFETFGGLDVRITDAAGNRLTGVVGPANISIAANTRSATPPAVASLMYFDTTAGLWVQTSVLANLVGTAPNQVYQGSVDRIAAWAAGQVYTPSNITVCVNDQNGQPISGARVNSDGIDYSGGGTATTDASGVAVVPMKRGGQAVITATSPRSSNSATISAAQSSANFTLTPCLIMPTAGMTIRLTWGLSPSDLDSHLKGPNSTHVYYISRGSLSAAPFAALDVDDVTSFGPEVISIVRLTQGTSEYFVHNFSGTFTPGMTGSPARIEVRVGSQIRIYFPAAGEGANRYWRVFQYTVASDCSVTITTLNSWAAAEPADPSGGATGTFCN
jgi:hypothetical protein